MLSRKGFTPPPRWRVALSVACPACVTTPRWVAAGGSKADYNATGGAANDDDNAVANRTKDIVVTGDSATGGVSNGDRVATGGVTSTDRVEDGVAAGGNGAGGVSGPKVWTWN